MIEMCNMNDTVYSLKSQSKIITGDILHERIFNVYSSDGFIRFS